MEFIKPGTRIPFTKYRRIAVILSTLVNLVVLALLFTKGPNLGVDFAGGTMVHLKFQQRVAIPEIRQTLEKIGFGDSVIQDFGQDGSNEFMIRLEKTSVQIGPLGDEIRRGLANHFGQDRFEVRRVESVGPKVGKDLRERGTWAVGVATVLMGGYVWVGFGASFGARFGFHFGLGAVIALVHDVLVTAGALMLAHYEFDLTVVAALLTIVGFSVN